MSTYFVAESKNSTENAGKAIVFEAKSLTGAKIKAMKLWQGNPFIVSTGATMLIVGDHIDASSHIDHVLSVKHGEYRGTEPAWFDNDLWIERKEVEEVPEAPALHVGDTVKVVGDNAKCFTDLVGLTGFIYDEVEDEAGIYFVVEFDHPVGGCLRWDFMPQNLEPISINGLV